MAMITRRTVMAGKPGTKRVKERYGSDFVCIRYKYDRESGKKIKTIELIIDEQDWVPNTASIPPNKTTYLHIRYGEWDIANRVKSFGGRWNRRKQVWELAYRYVIELGLEDRIVHT